jgi:hypothetical protein
LRGKDRRILEASPGKVNDTLNQKENKPATLEEEVGGLRSETSPSKSETLSEKYSK